MSHSSSAPRLAITLGDPHGIGPEVVLKSLQDESLQGRVVPIVVGSVDVLRAHAKALELEAPDLHPVEPPVETIPATGIPVVDVDGDAPPRVDFGEITAAGGALAMRAVEIATDACMDGWADAMVTAPLSKEAIARAGYQFPGHTGFIAERTGTELPLMMMVAGDLRVALVTVHVPIAEVAQRVTQEAIEKRLRILHQSLQRDFGIDEPRMAVLGLNPHAGDGGIIGCEEIDTIGPALEAVAADGLQAEGPFAADGFFATELDAGHDAALAMYHDQGLVPFKALAFDRGVNFTAGLPIVRTSPDHGTAFNIAGDGVASAGSMTHAIRLAAEVVEQRQKVREGGVGEWESGD